MAKKIKVPPRTWAIGFKIQCPKPKPWNHVKERPDANILIYG